MTHEVDAAAATVDTMAHHALLIPPRDKFAILASIANRRGRTLMFAKTQAGVDELVDQLAGVGVRAGGLHGGKTQRVRTRTLAEFREGRVDTLVATNVAARGLHVDGISLVVHIDPPADHKDYLHRAGRTARAGESGTVVTLVLPRQRRSTFTMLMRAGVVTAAGRGVGGRPGAGRGHRRAAALGCAATGAQAGAARGYPARPSRDPKVLTASTSEARDRT